MLRNWELTVCTVCSEIEGIPRPALFSIFPRMVKLSTYMVIVLRKGAVFRYRAGKVLLTFVLDCVSAHQVTNSTILERKERNIFIFDLMHYEKRPSPLSKRIRWEILEEKCIFVEFNSWKLCEKFQQANFDYNTNFLITLYFRHIAPITVRCCGMYPLAPKSDVKLLNLHDATEMTINHQSDYYAMQLCLLQAWKRC